MHFLATFVNARTRQIANTTSVNILACDKRDTITKINPFVIVIRSCNDQKDRYTSLNHFIFREISTRLTDVTGSSLNENEFLLDDFYIQLKKHDFRGNEFVRSNESFASSLLRIVDL